MGTENIAKIEYPQIDFNTFQKDIREFKLVYHDKEDTLFIRPDIVYPATSIDINGEIWLRVDINTGKIVGLVIDDFESIFLKRHPQLLKAWESVKPRCIHKKVFKNNNQALWDSFTKILANFILSLFESHPQQIPLTV